MESLKYLVSLVNDVLDMNKLQSGDLKDQQLLFDLTMALRKLNQIYDEQAAKKGIRYEIDWKMVHTVTALWVETRYIWEGFCRILWTMP